MKSIADRLPPEIARQIHPDRRTNEAAYWAARDQLLNQYQGQWIGFADGMVIASGTSPVTVFHAAEASGRHPFFICVGREEEPCRIRRVTCPYDTSYPGEALPSISVEFRQASGSAGIVMDRVIPDTGADASVFALGGLSTPAIGSGFGRTKLDRRCRGRFLGNARFSDLGATRRAGFPVSPASGLCRQRTHSGSRRSEPSGNPVSRSCR